MTGWSRETTWRQGAFIKAEDLPHLVELEKDSTFSSALAVSQDCDIANAPETEPNVEFVLVREIENVNGNYANCKNVRRLDLPLEAGGECLSAYTLERHHISKGELQNYEPCGEKCLSTASVAILQNWLASRYRRTALPDAFNDRLAPVLDKIKKAVAPSASSIEAILLDLCGNEQDELEDEEPYAVEIKVLYNDSVNAEAERDALKLANRLKEIFKTRFQDKKTEEWSSIELTTVTHTSVYTISYGDAQSLLRMNLDQVSFKKGEPDTTIKAPNSE